MFFFCFWMKHTKKHFFFLQKAKYFILFSIFSGVRPEITTHECKNILLTLCAIIFSNTAQLFFCSVGLWCWLIAFFCLKTYTLCICEHTKQTHQHTRKKISIQKHISTHKTEKKVATSKFVDLCMKH